MNYCKECGGPARHHRWDSHWCNEHFYAEFNRRTGYGHHP